MRMIELLGGGRLRLVDQPPPDRPLAAGEVEGPTEVSLVSPGTELQAYLGELGSPVSSGYATVFRIAARGSGVTDLREGQLVFAMGAHTGFQRFAARDVVPVPDGLAPEIAVFARLMGVSWTTLVTTRARPPARVLVTGLGIVGNLAAQIFAAAGYRVTAVDPAAGRRELALASLLLDVRASAPEPTDDGHFALAVECSGHESAVLDACRSVVWGGEVVLVGVPWQQRTDDSAHDLLDLVFHRFVSLRGGWEWQLPRYPQRFGIGSIRDSFAGAMGWLEEGRVNVDGLAEKVLPQDAGQAYAGLATSPQLTALFDWRDGR